MQKQELIIQIDYASLGDHLLHSHIPRIAKESGQYSAVFISSLSQGREELKQFIWDLNPYVDGFVNLPGKHANYLFEHVDRFFVRTKANKMCTTAADQQLLSSANILDLLMLSFNLDDGKRFHEPEIYYTPLFRREFHKHIYDPNYMSSGGIGLTYSAIAKIFRKRGIYIDAVMKSLSEKAVISHWGGETITAPTLREFADVIHSSQSLYCLTTGTATLAAALNKPVTVLYPPAFLKIFHHSPLHCYWEIPMDLKTRLKNIKVNLKNRCVKTGKRITKSIKKRIPPFFYF